MTDQIVPTAAPAVNPAPMSHVAYLRDEWQIAQNESNRLRAAIDDATGEDKAQAEQAWDVASQREFVAYWEYKEAYREEANCDLPRWQATAATTTSPFVKDAYTLLVDSTVSAQEAYEDHMGWLLEQHDAAIKTATSTPDAPIPFLLTPTAVPDNEYLPF